MRVAQNLRLASTALLGAVLTVQSTGCTHNYYYGGVPVACAPSTGGVVSSNVQYGSVCEVPSQVVGGGTVIATNPPSTPPALSGPRPPRVVVSDGPDSRPPWRRADPDSTRVTRVEGAVDDPTVTK